MADYQADVNFLRNQLKRYGMPVSDSMSLRELVQVLKMDYMLKRESEVYKTRNKTIDLIAKIVYGFRQSDDSSDLMIQMSKIIQNLNKEQK